MTDHYPNEQVLRHYFEENAGRYNSAKVVNLQEFSKDETIRKLEAELKAYKLEEEIDEVEQEIMHELNVMTKTFMLTVALEDKEMVLKGLKDYRDKIKKVNE